MMLQGQSLDAVRCSPRTELQDAVEFQRLVTLLGEFVAFQTVSSDSCWSDLDARTRLSNKRPVFRPKPRGRHEPDMQKAASWLARRFEELLGATAA